jgi:hypothetical protein
MRYLPGYGRLAMTAENLIKSDRLLGDKVYQYLYRGFEITHRNHFWAADIIYVSA